MGRVGRGEQSSARAAGPDRSFELDSGQLCVFRGTMETQVALPASWPLGGPHALCDPQQCFTWRFTEITSQIVMAQLWVGKPLTYLVHLS